MYRTTSTASTTGTTSTARTTGPRGRRRALATALAVLASSAALTAVTAAPAEAYDPPREVRSAPRVVFTEHRNVDGVRTDTLVTVNSDGTDRRVLVPTGKGLPKAEITGVTYSPDGVYMAFISNDGFADIWVAHADGTNARLVRKDVDEPDGWLSGLDWTPDGKQLYLSFTAKPGHDRLRIMKVNLDGTGLGYLFAQPERTWDTQVDVAPDGRIVFVRGGTIHTWEPKKGGDPKPLVRGLHPTFGQTSTDISYANGDDGTYDVHARGVDEPVDSGAERIITRGQNVLRPEWAPTTLSFAYLAGGTEQKATVTHPLQSGRIVTLSAPGTTASDISWVNPVGLNEGWDTFRRDYSGDGVPDLLAQDAAGVLWRYDGDGKGGLKSRVKIGWGWKGYRFTAVGDLSGDGFPDVLAQDAAGDLWRVDGDGLGGLRPKVKIGWGWQKMRLTASGDFRDEHPVGTGSRTPDVLAIDAQGAMWVYAGNGKGGFLPRVQYGSGYQNYQVTAVGDLAGKGATAHLAQDVAGNLFRYGPGREKIGWGWKNLTLTGAGDMTKDGVPDVIARDTAGDLWRYDGDGKGGLKSRVKIGWGWKGINTF
ncbi:FG-GAP-like repeat-containing protein [Streptomyces sp. NPDC059247]|uniref:FG-GAP-like repeat-containing protein n=1 Tax=Streptomyces sp. NPDC059247 TaxID=3346790 RepID=UPI0036A53071